MSRRWCFYIRTIVFVYLFCCLPTLSQTIVSDTVAPCVRHSSSPSMTVGLVLSGGGARGIAHIGLIQALEENDIPIDYITGTSIGAVIGSMYAIGMTPREMLQLVKTPDFQMWQTGNIDRMWSEFYKEAPPKPKSIQAKLILGDSLLLKNMLLPRLSLIDPSAMKFGMFEIYSRHSFRCRHSFDNLFVPLRTVASDICTNSQVIFDSGDLSIAVRSSMAFPFVFRPVVYNGLLLYDGGIYNNFPVDVMQREFHPDFIIGSMVCEEPNCPKDGDLRGQLESMITQTTEYRVPDDNGMIVRISLPSVSLLDFSRVDAIYSIGYAHGLSIVDSLRMRVERHVPQREVSEARRRYLSEVKPLEISRLEVEGVDPGQMLYILRHFPSLDITSLRAGFYALASDDKISEIDISLHHLATEDSIIDAAQSQEMYALLKIKLNRDFKLRIGGLIGAPDRNRFYMGIGYKGVRQVATAVDLDMQLGYAYSSFSSEVRTEIPTTIPFVNIFRIGWQHRRYSRDDMYLSPSDSLKELRLEDLYASWNLCFPLAKRVKLTTTLGYGFWNDRATTSLPDTLWMDRQEWLRFGTSVEGAKMKEMFYPDEGYRWRFEWLSYYNTAHRWDKLSASWEKYFQLSRIFALGCRADAVWSNMSLDSDSPLSLARLPQYAPEGYSMQVYNAWLHAHNFVAVGIDPVFKLKHSLQLRISSSLMIPWSKDNVLCYDRHIRGIYEATLVYKTPVADIACFVHCFDAHRSQWHLGLKFGFLLNEDSF